MSVDYYRQSVVVVLCDILAAILGTSGGENVNVASWGGVATSLGQKLKAASVPVTIASDQWAAGSTTLTRTSTATSGTVAAGAYSVTIANVGGSDGTVLTVAIKPGQTLNFNAVADNAAQIFKKLPAIAYDGTGTTLLLTVMT